MSENEEEQTGTFSPVGLCSHGTNFFFLLSQLVPRSPNLLIQLGVNSSFIAALSPEFLCPTGTCTVAFGLDGRHVANAVLATMMPTTKPLESASGSESCLFSLWIKSACCGSDKLIEVQITPLSLLQPSDSLPGNRWTWSLYL